MILVSLQSSPRRYSVAVKTKDREKEKRDKRYRRDWNQLREKSIFILVHNYYVMHGKGGGEKSSRNFGISFASHFASKVDL